MEMIKKHIKKYNLNKIDEDFALQMFSSGFEFGSINGASEDIKRSAIDTIDTDHDKKASEQLEKFRELIH